MAWTNWGFDGTINEAQWAQMAGLLGNDYVAAGNSDCLVTAVPGARSVSVAAGTLYGDGVVSVNDGAETVAMTTPVNGQWYVIALRRTWATNTAALVAIAGATTSTTTPTAPPTSFPTLNTNKGVLTDQPIAWAWCNSANTTVVVYDIRMRAVKSLPPVVANQGERDAKFMTPTQGVQVWRNDLGAVETYYGLYNASTNPGGRDTAGWYTSGRNNGLIPIAPTSVSVSGGTASVNDLGVVTFSSGTTQITLNGVFSSQYKTYKVILSRSAQSGYAGIYYRWSSNGTPTTANLYQRAGFYFYANGSTGAVNGQSATSLLWGEGTGTVEGLFELEVQGVAESRFTSAISNAMGRYTTGVPSGILQYNTYEANTVFDGIQVAPTTGTFGGTLQVFGYND